jgi:nitrous oxidase accessory protein NosD
MTDRHGPPWDQQIHDVDTEDLLAEWFEEEAPTREPAVLAPNVIARTALTRRRSRYFVRDWWRDLFRNDQRTSLKPALFASSIATLAILLVMVVVVLPRGIETETQPPTYPGDALVVSPDDSANRSTISEAIAAAVAGDTVAILPGMYTENLVVDKDITLLGAGERDAIVLQPADPTLPIVELDSVDATMTGFTITGPGSTVSIVSGSPLIENMTFRDVGDQWWTYTGASWHGFEEAAPSINVELFADTIIRNNTFDGGGEIAIHDGSTAQILDNTLINGPAIFLEDASDDTVVKGNTITDSGLYSIESTSHSDLLIEGNIITQSAPGVGIQAVGLTGTIRNNQIRGAQAGIQIHDDDPTVTGNIIDSVGVALEIGSGIDPEISDNELCGKNSILALTPDAVAPDLAGNKLCNAPLTYE